MPLNIDALPHNANWLKRPRPQEPEALVQDVPVSVAMRQSDVRHFRSNGPSGTLPGGALGEGSPAMNGPTDEQTLRDRATKALRKKRDFTSHLVTYVAVNGLLIVIWATVGGDGFFWPVFPLLGWGIGVLLHGWDVYRGEPTEEAIRREMERLR